MQLLREEMIDLIAQGTTQCFFACLVPFVGCLLLAPSWYCSPAFFMSQHCQEIADFE